MEVSAGGIDDSNGCGVAEDFFSRCGEDTGVAVGEAFLFLGLGDGDSSSVDGVLFFPGEGAGDEIGDSCARAGDVFFDGDGVGVGVFLFVAAVVFFFLGFGVGVGVEKIFFNAAPRDCSAVLAVSIGERTSAITIRMRSIM